jgi:transposase
MMKPIVLEIELADAPAVLERARTLLMPDDHAYVTALHRTLVELLRLAHERGTTISRIRRLFQLHNSEKLADLYPTTASPIPAQTDEPTEPDASSDGEPAPSDTSERASATAVPTADEAPDADRAADDDRAEHAEISLANPNTSSEASGANANANVGPATTESKKREGHGRIGAAGYRPARRDYVAHDRLHVGDTCPGCAHGRLYDLNRPSCILRIIGQAPLAAVIWDCQQLRCSGCGHVFTADAPAEAQGPKYDPTAVATLGLSRYDYGMPLNRLARLQRQLDCPVPASTQWEVVRDRVGAFEPIFDELRRRAAMGRVLHNDDTTMRILALMGKRREELLAAGALPDPERTGLFTTATVSITDAGPIALFATGRKHAGENLTELLALRDAAASPPPIHMCDGLDRNRPKGHTVVECNCLAHGRRHVVDEVVNFPTECRHVLEALGKVFKHDDDCREQGLSADERLASHQENSGPVMAELEQWIKAELDGHRIEPNSGFGRALQYLQKRWPQLTLFLRVAGAPIDNNICERALKMAIRHRNNSLFYRTEYGAYVGDVYMTVISTTNLHHENPFDYLVALLHHEAEVAADPGAWLPWTYRATLERIQTSATALAAAA